MNLSASTLFGALIAYLLFSLAANIVGGIAIIAVIISGGLH